MLWCLMIFFFILVHKIISKLHQLEAVGRYIIQSHSLSCIITVGKIIFTIYNSGHGHNGSWIYNNLCLSPLMLWFWIPFMVRCTRYIIIKPKRKIYVSDFQTCPNLLLIFFKPYQDSLLEKGRIFYSALNLFSKFSIQYQLHKHSFEYVVI